MAAAGPGELHRSHIIGDCRGFGDFQHCDFELSDFALCDGGPWGEACASSGVD